MKNFMEMTVASHAEACSTGAQNIEASEKMTASSGMVTRADSSLLHEHRQELVLELRLQHGALREARAQLADVRLHRRPRVLGARAGSGPMVSSAPVHRLPRQAARPMRTRTAATLGRALRGLRKSRQIPKFAFIKAQSGQHGLHAATLPACRRSRSRLVLARPTSLLYHCLNGRQGSEAPMKILQTKTAPNPRRVRIFLAEKGHRGALEELDLMQGALKTPEFTKLNRFQRVPVLVLDDGTAIAETMAICRYFEETKPGAGPVRQGRQAARARRDVEPAHGAGAAVQRGPGVPTPASGRGAARGAAGGRLGRGQQAAGRRKSCSSWTRSWASGASSPAMTIRSPILRRWWPSISREPARIQRPRALKNLARWHEEVSARPSAKA